MSQLAEMASFWTSLGNPYRSVLTSLTHYEGLDPAVQEIAVLALMHNMASMLKNPEKIKTTLSAEIARSASAAALVPRLIRRTREKHAFKPLDIGECVGVFERRAGEMPLHRIATFGTQELELIVRLNSLGDNE